MPHTDQPPNDALVVFMPSGRRGRFALGTTLLDAARSVGVYIESVCGGRGMCRRCQVEPVLGSFAKENIESAPASFSPRTEAEHLFAQRGRLADDRRQSCQAKILGDMVVNVPVESGASTVIVRKRAEARAMPRNPATRLCYVEIAPASLDEPAGDVDRLLAALSREWGLENLVIDPALLPTVQVVLRKGDWKVTAAVHGQDTATVVTALWPGLHNQLLGLAVDIGSTTIAAHLVNLLTGRTLSSVGAANPQIRFGEDLMSRVSYIMMNEGGEAALTKTVRHAINTLTGQAADEIGAPVTSIVEAVLVGNPIMHHLVLGISPVELGGAPFALAVSGAVRVPARDIGLDFCPGAQVYLPPCIAGHVGADASAAILATEPHKSPEMTLIVDIGTNAEIILGNSTKLFAASSPTGPAFEGAQISAGQRAAPGAIERVRIDPETMEPRVRVIGSDLWSDDEGFGDATAKIGVTGLCGSGIIEVIAEMYLAGIISSDGVIDGTLNNQRIVADGRTFSYILWPGNQGPGDQELRVTQGDVRAIQLAKGALYAGIKLLADRLDGAPIARIRLAGAFGSHIDPKYAMVLGLIPDCALENVSSVGNAAGTGARMVLLDRTSRGALEALVCQIEKIETATEARFQDYFVDAMAFPNKTDPFSLLRAQVPLPARAEPRRAARRRRNPRAKR
ncbi:MAG: ASKHA domain-containing protein [Alphaproteobacteria bacterium]